jgi:hypothetical protein
LFSADVATLLLQANSVGQQPLLIARAKMADLQIQKVGTNGGTSFHWMIKPTGLVNKKLNPQSLISQN